MTNDTETGDKDREAVSEYGVIAELVERGIARPQYEHKRGGQTCMNPGCDNTVPENSHKKLNLGAGSGYCSVVCNMEDDRP